MLTVFKQRNLIEFSIFFYEDMLFGGIFLFSALNNNCYLFKANEKNTHNKRQTLFKLQCQ